MNHTADGSPEQAHADRGVPGPFTFRGGPGQPDTPQHWTESDSERLTPPLEGLPEAAVEAPPSGKAGASGGPFGSVSEGAKAGQGNLIPPVNSGRRWGSKTYGNFRTHDFDRIEAKRKGRTYEPSQVEKRLRRLDRHARHRWRITDFLRSGNVPEAERYGAAELLARLETCGAWAAFEQFPTIEGRPVQLASGSMCKLPLFCETCAGFRAWDLVRAYVARIRQVLASGKFVPYMVTLTLPNTEDLRPVFSDLRRFGARLIELAKYSRSGRWCGCSAVGEIAGGVLSMEIIRGRGGLWHPHFHGLLLMSRDLLDVQATELLEFWSDMVGGNARSNHIRQIASEELIAKSLAFLDVVNVDVMSNCLEVFKYPLKFTAMSGEDLWDVRRVLPRGARLIRNFGVLRGVQVSSDMKHKRLSSKDLPSLRAYYVRREGRLVWQSGDVFLDSVSVNC